MEETWIPHEIHPDTPPQGRIMTELFDQIDIDQVTMSCNQRGKPYGIRFKEMTLLANSRLALEAAEFARDAGAFQAFHGRIFEAYFTDGRNIGDLSVILDEAVRCGLDTYALKTALDERVHAGTVAEGSMAARAAGVTAIPTFLIPGQPPITGAVHEEVIRKALQQAASVIPS
ncbi:DsbA family protein [Pseudodesulfovibrio sp. S3-i]|nr:DsbA family protein [Pseudodesulfovibrio sp. S3-i]